MLNLYNYFPSSKTIKSKKNEEKNDDRKNKKKVYEGKRKRNFLPGWKGDFEWVRFDEILKAMFCISCELYDTSKSSVFATTGSTSFRVDSLKSHETSSNHIEAVRKHNIKKLKDQDKVAICSYTGEIVSQEFKDSQINPGSGAVIGVMDLMKKKMSEDQLKQLCVFVNTAYWIAKRELPFHTYPSLLDLQEINGVKLLDNYRNVNACRR